jgi:hypothetical protein
MLKKMVQEANAILQVLTLSLKGLTIFRHWIMVQELVSILSTNIVLLENKLKQFEKELKTLE